MITFMIYLNIRKMIVFVSLMKLRQDAILLSCEVHAAESWQTNLDKDWFRVFPTAVQPSWEFIPCLLIPHCHDFDRQISQEVLHLLAHWEGFKPTSPKMATGIKRTCFFMFFQVAPCEQLARWSWRCTSLGPAWVSASTSLKLQCFALDVSERAISSMKHPMNDSEFACVQIWSLQRKWDWCLLLRSIRPRHSRNNYEKLAPTFMNEY